jgi:hypothetical protein
MKKAGDKTLASQGMDFKEDMIYTSQCCGSGMFIPDPDFSIPDPGSRNPDPTTIAKMEGSIFFCLTFFVAINLQK